MIRGSKCLKRRGITNLPFCLGPNDVSKSIVGRRLKENAEGREEGLFTRRCLQGVSDKTQVSKQKGEQVRVI